MSFEEQLVNEINEFRTNPKAYAKKVEKYISYFKGKTMIIPGSKAGMKTEEGAEPFKEAVDVLSKTEPVEPLEPSKGLERIAKDFLAEVLKVDPNELNNINVDDIMQKYGSFLGSMNREVDMGNETPEQVVMSLIASDGDQTRSHRECLLSTDLKKIGVANGKHPTYRHCTIIFFCTKFTNNVDKDDHGYINGSSTVTGEKKVEGQTLKPKKVVLNKPKEEPKKEEPQNDNKGIMRNDVVSEQIKEKIVEENGKKLKISRIIRTLKDGSKEIDTIKKEYKEGEDDDDF
jgi:hypothetical protein